MTNVMDPLRVVRGGKGKRHMARRRWGLLGVVAAASIATGCAKVPAPVAAPPVPIVKAKPVEAAPAAVEKPAPAAPAASESLTIRPATVELAADDPGVQLLATAKGSHGGRRDVTGEAAWTVEPAGVVAVDRTGYLTPIGPGRATLRAGFDGSDA